LPKIYQARSVESALEKAEGFRQSGTYDWFRGQLHAWPLRPSLFRDSSEAFQDRVERVNRFGDWVAATAGIENLQRDRDLLLAVAQHYRLPTTLIDFTTDTRIAAFFAASGSRQSGRKVPKWSCIYCLNSEEVKLRLEANPIRDRIRLVAPVVDDLWRLQAQKGVFLDVRVSGSFVDNVLLDMFVPFAMIRFPFKGPFSGIAADEVYPTRKSHLEYLLERYFQVEYLYSAAQAMNNNPELFGAQINEEPVEWGGEPKAFRSGTLPGLHWSWPLKTGTVWITPPPEVFSTAPSQPFCLNLSSNESVAEARTYYLNQLSELLQRDSNTRKLCVRFECEGEEHAGLARQLEVIWDGMRRFSFTDLQIATALTSRILLATEGSMRKLFGRTTLVELGSDDGSYTMAHCAIDSLRGAFRPDLQELVVEKEWGRIVDNPSEALRILIEPKRLFCFEPFVQLFAEQIIPTQARLTWGTEGQDYCFVFSPIRVDRFGLH
jgi:hypothetical protein